MDFERLAVVSCPLCRSRKVSKWVTGKDHRLQLDGSAFPYCRCEVCGLYFQSTPPTAHEIGRWYQGGYSPYGESSKQPKRRSLRASIARRASYLSAACTGARQTGKLVRLFYDEQFRPGRVFLDFGCGSGGCLDQARRRQCSTIGMDVSARMLALVASHGHVSLPASEAGFRAIEPGTVSIVRMNHVIEHLYDPRTTLGELHRTMRLGAHIHIATPNPEGPSARNFLANWWALDAPRHIVLFTPDRLSSLLSDVGFRDVRILQEQLPRDWLLSKLRQAGEPEDIEARVLPLSILAVTPRLMRAARKGAADRYHLLATR